VVLAASHGHSAEECKSDASRVHAFISPKGRAP
jgi:hypothetical protein